MESINPADPPCGGPSGGPGGDQSGASDLVGVWNGQIVADFRHGNTLVDWDVIFNYAAGASVPFPTVWGDAAELLAWLNRIPWATGAAWLTALSASVGQTSDGHLPPDPSKCPDKDHFWNADQAPHKGWTWDGGGGNVPPGSVGGRWVGPGGQLLIPDLNHPAPKPPHWEYIDVLGKSWECDKAGDIFEKGVQWW